MRVLLLGSGGREHALARALAADADVTDLHAAPGNPGIAAIAATHPVDLADIAAVTTLARSVAADLVVVGPEAPLVAGLADALQAAGIACFGPGRQAAMLEGSKSFAKQVMTAAGIPTARARTCTSETDAAAVRLSPAYSRPRYGMPRRRISSTAGWMTLARTSPASAGGAQPSGT